MADPIVSDTLNTAATAALDKILAKVPAPIADAARLYSPVILRLLQSDLYATVDKIAAGDGVASQALLRAAMTLDELAAEKTQLAVLTEKMASESFEARAAYAQVFDAAFRVGLTVALASVGL